MCTLKMCDELRGELKIKSGMSNSHDPLYEYRLWWDGQGIKSEGNDGWPLPFCFEDANIVAFSMYWNT